MRTFHFSPIAIAAIAIASAAPAYAGDDVTFTGFAHGSQSVDFSLFAPNAPTMIVIGVRMLIAAVARSVTKYVEPRSLPAIGVSQTH